MTDKVKKALRRRKRVGRRGENIAVTFLQEKGYTIIDRNVRMKAGEIDIVVRDGLQIVFVEVKTRTSTLFSPRTGWSVGQQKRLQQCANEYIQKAELFQLVWRIELVEVVLGKWFFCKKITHRQAVARDYIERYRNYGDQRVKRFP